MKKLLIVLVLLAVAGCNEVVKQENPDIKPLTGHLTPINDEWKATYGDTSEAQIVYNLAILRQNDLVIASVMNKMHPKEDPNVPTLESRVEALERPEDDPNELNIEKISDIRRIQWPPADRKQEQYQFNREIAQKINEIIDRLNNK